MPAQRLHWQQLHEEVARLNRQRQYDAMLATALEALRVAQDSFGGAHPATAVSTYDIAFAYDALGKYRQAEVYYKKALTLEEHAFGPAHRETLKCLNNLAILYLRTDRPDEAEPLLLRVIRTGQSSSQPSVLTAVGMAAFNLAAHYSQQGSFDAAEPLFELSLAIAGRKDVNLPLSPEYILDRFARSLYKQGKFDESEAAFKQSIQIHRNGSVQPTLALAMALNGLGELYRSAGKFADAEAPLRESLQIISRLAGQENENYAMVLNNLGLLYKDQGRYAEAEPLHRSSLEIVSKVLGPNHVEVTFPLNGLAALFIAQERLSEAEPLLRRALEIREKVYAADSPAVATLINNLAVVYGKQGRYTEAAPLYRRALLFDEKALGPDHPVVGTDAGNLGRAYWRLNRPADAEKLLKRALRIANDALGPDHPGTLHALTNLGLFYYGQGDYSDTGKLLDRAVVMLKRQFVYQFTYMSEKDRLSFLSAAQNTVSLYLSFCRRFQGQRPALAGKMYDLALWHKGLIARSISSLRRRIEASGDTLAITLTKQIRLRKTRLASLQMVPSTGPRASRDAILALKEEINDLETKLVRHSSAYAEREHLAGVTWRDIAKKLQDNEAAIEITRFRSRNEKGYTGDSYYVAMLLSGARPARPQVVWLGKATDIEGQPFEAYRKWVKAGPPPDDDAGIAFYKAVWRPLEPMLSGIERIYLSPAGLFNEVSWAVVPATDGHLLLEKYDLQLLLSTRDLMRSPSTATGRSAVLIGAPDFDLTAAEQRHSARKIRTDATASALTMVRDRRLRSSAVGRSTLAPLPGARKELQTLRALLQNHGWQVSLLMGPDALEEHLKSLKPARLLHIATHGFFMPDEDDFSIDSLAAESAVFDEPMLRARLYFAGANRALNGNPPAGGLDDGVLTAYEAMDLNLKGTELAVLSACDTGLGVTQNSEGVFGLRRALQEAGVEAVLMSLWQIPDRDTEELMRLFYEAWLSGANKPAALREAQLEMRERIRSRRGGQDVPYYWGAFVLVGR
jgi:CHAT domain-containing protein/Flp pilus assembly protein TadD